MNKPFDTVIEQEDRAAGWRLPGGLSRRIADRKSDFALGMAGAGAAVASAVFALVMTNADIRSPSFGGSEYLLLFTRPLQAARTPSPQFAARPADQGIDFTVTGSIGAIRPKTTEVLNPGQVLDTPLAARQPIPPPRTSSLPLNDYKVRAVRGGVAIITGPTGNFAVENGSLLPNGDIVFSIDRRDGKWVVVTSSGVIEDQ